MGSEGYKVMFRQVELNADPTETVTGLGARPGEILRVLAPAGLRSHDVSYGINESSGARGSCPLSDVMGVGSDLKGEEGEGEGKGEGEGEGEGGGHSKRLRPRSAGSRRGARIARTSTVASLDARRRSLPKLERQRPLKGDAVYVLPSTQRILAQVATGGAAVLLGSYEYVYTTGVYAPHHPRCDTRSPLC
jgi:hypothetical protein